MSEALEGQRATIASRPADLPVSFTAVRRKDYVESTQTLDHDKCLPSYLSIMAGSWLEEVLKEMLEVETDRVGRLAPTLDALEFRNFGPKVG